LLALNNIFNASWHRQHAPIAAIAESGRFASSTEQTMKRLCFVAFAAMLLPAVTLAQDALAVAPENFKLLAENDKVRVLEHIQDKGAQVPMHSHPALVVYVLKGGILRFTFPDGKTSERTSKTGDVLLLEPVTHAHEALSDFPGIAIELKR
jgi:beta-alanine degradation protein BauB